MEKYNNNFYDFKLVNNRIICYHYYGKNRKNSIKIMCNLKNTDDPTIKKGVSTIKKTIKEEKKYLTPLHGCTDYLNTINL